MSHMTRVEYYTPVPLVLLLISHILSSAPPDNTNPADNSHKAEDLSQTKPCEFLFYMFFSHNFQHFIIYLQVQTLIIFLHLLYPQNCDARRTNLRKGKILILVSIKRILWSYASDKKYHEGRKIFDFIMS